MPYWRLFYHVVWATKGREPIIGEREERIIRQSLAETFEELAIIPHAVGLVPDHLHVAVSIPPKVAVAELVKRMKGASSRTVNQAMGNRFGWQEEYGVLSFSERALPDVVAYVTDQPARHAAARLWPGLERIADAPGRPGDALGHATEIGSAEG